MPIKARSRLSRNSVKELSQAPQISARTSTNPGSAEVARVSRSSAQKQQRLVSSVQCHSYLSLPTIHYIFICGLEHGNPSRGADVTGQGARSFSPSHLISPASLSSTSFVSFDISGLCGGCSIKMYLADLGQRSDGICPDLLEDSERPIFL